MRILSYPTIDLCLCGATTLVMSLFHPRLAAISVLAGLIFSHIEKNVISTPIKERVVKVMDSHWSLRFLKSLTPFIFRPINIPADNIDSNVSLIYIATLRILLSPLFVNDHPRFFLRKFDYLPIVGASLKFGNLVYRMNHYYRG